MYKKNWHIDEADVCRIWLIASGTNANIQPILNNRRERIGLVLAFDKFARFFFWMFTVSPSAVQFPYCEIGIGASGDTSVG